MTIDASTVSYSAPGAGTVPVSAADLFDVAITKGAGADGVTPATAAIQMAIDEVHARGGGVVQLEAGSYKLGSSGLVLRSNVMLSGAATRYAGSTTKGTRLLFSGTTGAAIYGPSIVDAEVSDLSIECTAASGSDITGMWLNGCWKGRFINVTVLGTTPEKGTSIRLDTNPGASWRAQHNYFEGCETPDGVFLFQGATGNDGSTTNVVNTNRSLRYRIVNSQVTFINATAEGFIDGPGFDFSGASCDGVLVGCDIEGSGGGFPGIAIAAPAEVREIGTLWLGFYGPQRVAGAMASVPHYDGLTLEANVSGAQAGDGVYANSRRCVVCNNAGTLSLTQEAALVTGVNQQLSFVVSGVDVLVQVTPATANSSTVKARCRITGSWTGYT